MTAKSDALLEAGRRYGDAAAAREKALYAWERDQPRDEMVATREACIEAEGVLRRAARAYATSVRKRRQRP